jgi:arabinogalactan oligomer/maltooligosaccharide transport system permease protein
LASWRLGGLPLLFVVALLTLAPGCAEPPSVVVWHAYRGDEERTLVRLAREYERSTGVRIELLSVPWEAYSAKLDAAVPHAHGPDVFIEAHERLGFYRKDAVVAPAGDALPDAEVADYDAIAVRALTEDGARWGVPLATKCVALYVNDDLLARAHPEEKQALTGPSWAPPSLEAIAALRASLPESAYPLVYEAQAPYYHAAVLSAFGGRMLADDGTFGFVGPNAARSVDFVRKLTADRIIPDEPSGALVKQLFAGGRAATAIDGPWLAADLGTAPAGLSTAGTRAREGRTLRYHVVPLPAIAETGVRMRPPLTVEAAMLSPTGAKRPEAVAFARWLARGEAAVTRAIDAHQVVAARAAWLDPRVASDDLLAAFHDATADAEPMPTSTRMRATWVPAQEAIRKALRGDEPSEAALEEARRRFEDALKPPPPPPSPAPLAAAVGLVALAGALFAVRRARTPEFRRALRGSRGAYRYVVHAAFVVLVLVVLPLAAGAVTSLFSGSRDDPRYVGLGNYAAILTARGGPLLGHESFYLTLAVTVLWTLCNVALHLALGVTLGVLLSRPAMKLKTAYRVLLILPWAVPNYVTALAWKGMFHRQFGAVNAVLGALGVEPVSWFSHFATAFAANVATNVWLGFPFMLVVTLGALTSVPREVLEAAEVDGATRWQRFWRVTVPLLRPTMLPAVVLGSVWTFNMFNVVFLVSGGEPDGTTDILVSDAYRWAFTRDAQYGYAAAYAVLIFVILASGSKLLSRIGSHRQQRDERETAT